MYDVKNGDGRPAFAKALAGKAGIRRQEYKVKYPFEEPAPLRRGGWGM
jgi:hypothetical protein